MTASNPTLGAIVLAAGASRRMGQPKQLMPFGGETLLRRACHASLSVAAPVVAVLGANAAACEENIGDLPISVTVNFRWEDGMSGSLRAGLRRLLELAPACRGVLVTLVDQPFVTDAHLASLHRIWSQDSVPIVAAAYRGLAGVPAIFARCFFPELLDLEGDTGARAVIARHVSKTATIEMPEAAIDADTPADYERIVQGQPA